MENRIDISGNSYESIPGNCTECHFYVGIYCTIPDFCINEISFCYKLVEQSKDCNLIELTARIQRQQAIVDDVKENILKPAMDKLNASMQIMAELICFCEVGDKIQKNGNKPFIVSEILHDGFGGYYLKGKQFTDTYEGSFLLCEDWEEWEIINKR